MNIQIYGKAKCFDTKKAERYFKEYKKQSNAAGLLLNLIEQSQEEIFYLSTVKQALEQITDKHYDVILNKEDLIYSAEPRIIKLHGSFPSTFPFVINCS